MLNKRQSMTIIDLNRIELVITARITNLCEKNLKLKRAA